MTANATVRTPADITVIATCPTCEQPTAIRMQIGAELLVTDDGAELRVKGKSKGVAHLCDQLPLMGLDHDGQDADFDRQLGAAVTDALVDAVERRSDAAGELVDLAERTGTDITVAANGRTATIRGRKVDIDTGEILRGRVSCPLPDCTYSAENDGSIPAHIAMAHPASGPLS